jgi:hypothetical protein
MLFIIILLSLCICCHKDFEQGEPPSFELIQDSGFISGSVSVPAGSLMKFKVHARQGSEKITNFFIEVQEPVSGERYRMFDTALYTSELNWEGSFYKSALPMEGWTFVVRDRIGQGSGDVCYFTTDTNSAYQPILSISNVILGAQNNEITGGFYSIGSNSIYHGPEAKVNQENIDIVFYHGEDALTIASPGANIEAGIFDESFSPVNWVVRNTTRYIKTSLSAANFDHVINDSLMIALYIDADGKRKAKNLAGGDIYVFKNRQNRLGLFRVNVASGATDGMIDFDIKIQEAEK